ncbi:hypothetical protein BJX68DRAFT_268820 [Aspergillus pseudodeflectus]|uniref:Uncharacterized protein n=1 Tax=Aspergillus pseudodeflectus TaxID=176178 RepID=A0ABR4K0V8_9EURO
MAASAHTGTDNAPRTVRDLPENTRLRSGLPTHKGYDAVQDTNRVLKARKAKCKCGEQEYMRKKVRKAIAVQGDWLPASKRFISQLQYIELEQYRIYLKIIEARRDDHYDSRTIAEAIRMLERQNPLAWMDDETVDIMKEHENDIDGCKELDWFMQIANTETMQESIALEKELG